jgi:peptidyl-prolyl cis-trans isomerase D
MLDAMRQAASGWVAKILLGLLVASFAIWGISGEFFGYGAGTLAEVGEEDVSALDYQRELQQRVEALGEQFGRALTTEQARARGVPVQVFGQLVSEAAMDDEARARNLGVSDEKLRAVIAEDPAFQAAGRNPQQFEALLRNAGLTPDAYIRDLREQILRRQLASAVAAGVTAPQPLVEALYRYQNEERTVSTVVVGEDAIEPVGEPDNAVLEAYFEDNREQFRAPEYRALGLIALDAEALAGAAEVSDAELVQAYEARRQDFTVPERRRIEQIRFQTEEEARAALAQLQANPDLRALAEARGLNPADVNLGLKTKAEIIDARVAEAAFAARPNTILPVLDAALGPTIVHVAEVEPGATKTLEEAAPQLRQEIARARAQERVVEVYDQVEDERAAGTTLQEIAAKLSLPYRTVEAVARDGSTPAGERLTNLPAQEALLADAFESDVGVENNPIRTPDEGYVFYEVTEILPERERTLEEARADVAAAWRREETARRVAERAEVLAQRLRAGESLEAIAAEIGAQVRRLEGVRRSGDPNGALSRNALAQAFAGPKGHVANAEAEEPPARILLRVDAVTAPAYFAESADAKAITARLGQALQSDLLQAYNAQLLATRDTRVNQTLYSQLVAGATAEQP